MPDYEKSIINYNGLQKQFACKTASAQGCDGYSWPQACKDLKENRADVVGLNCGRSPQTMLPILEKIRQEVDGHVVALPVSYRTDHRRLSFFDLQLPGGNNAFPVALDPFLLTRFEMAGFTLAARDMGFQTIGNCCGAGPHQVRDMAEAVGRKVSASEYSPGLNFHPIIGDRKAPQKLYRECLLGPAADSPDAGRQADWTGSPGGKGLSAR